METLFREFKLALRQIRQSPGFAIATVLTLTVCIGATTAIFTLVNDVLLRPLPYDHSSQLVVINERVAEFTGPHPELPVNANHFTVWQKYSHSFQSMALMDEASMPLGTGEHPLQLSVLRSTPEIFAVLRSVPMLGRTFTAVENQPGHQRVIILTYDLWRNTFQADAHILGRTVTLNGFPYTVIGVMPRSFHFPRVTSLSSSGTLRPKQPEAIVPSALPSSELQVEMGNFNYFCLARLNIDTSLAQANAELNAMQNTIARNLPAGEQATLSTVLTPFQEAMIGENRIPLLLLLGGVLGMLLIGCANVLNHSIVRTVSRRRNLAIQTALGARRMDLIFTSMRETVVLAIMGGALGIVLAILMMIAMRAELPADLVFRGSIQIDWMSACFALLLSAVAMVIGGLIPAWISTSGNPQAGLREDMHLSGESRNGKRIRSILVGVQTAASVALVLMASLLAVSVMRLLSVDRGYDSDHALAAMINLPANAYPKRPDRIVFYRRALDAISVLPGIQAAGVVSVLPLSGDAWGDTARLPNDGRPLAQMQTENFRWVSPGYLEAIHLPLVAGRTFTSEDEGKNFAVISELAAHTLWPGKNAIGQEFFRGDPDPEEKSFTVIGVVGNARTITLAQQDPMMIYVPYWYRAGAIAGLVVRVHGDPRMAIGALSKSIWSIDPAISIPTVQTFERHAVESIDTMRFEMDLLALFSACAVLLAGLGMYSVVSYSVLQRKKEISLRMALGAAPNAIYMLVLLRGMTPVVIGTITGVGLSFLCGKILRSVLFQASPYNPVMALGAAGILLAIGTGVCLLAARCAITKNLLTELRSE